MEPSKTEAVEQLGPLVHVERESEEIDEEGQKEMGIVDPDRLLLEKAEQIKDGVKELDGRMEEEGEKANDDQEHREETAPQIRQFTGTAALALPPERGQRLDRLDLEVQIRPQSPNGMILYATTTASSPSSSKEAEKQQIIHNLELANGQPKYSFRVGGEIHEVLLADQKVPLDQWSTIRIINDGKGQASIRVNSGPPNELYYNPSQMLAPTPGSPVRIFVGGIDPRIRQTESASVNFIGAIGRLRLNQKNLNLAERSREESGRFEGGEDGDAHLDQQENQCSREPCRNNGQCRLTRFGGFQCQCKAGFTGRLCEFPSTDGVCSHDGRRWCHRGICILPERGSHHPFPFQCLCPPNWSGQRCETFVKPDDDDEEGIRFDGKHSFLAIPLGQSADGGEEAIDGQGFSVEFRLIPELGKKPSVAGGNDDQLIAILVGMDNAETAAIIGIQSGRLWAMQRKEGEEAATKRFLSKRIKAKKTHRIGLEQSGPGEIHLLIGGKPKGTILGPDGQSPPLLLLGGMPPRGMNISNEMMAHLPKGIGHFEGCLDELNVNGRKLAWRDMAKMQAANLAKCQPKGEEEHESKEELPPPTQPSTPYTPLPVVSISEDPLLAEQEASERAMMGPEGEPIDGREEERKLWEPIQLTGTISPDPLPSSTDRPPAVLPTEEEAMFESAEILSTLEPSTEAPFIDETTTQETSPSSSTIIDEEPTSSMEWFTTAFPSIESTTSPWSIEEDDELDQPTTLMPVPATPTPTWMIGPDSAELEGPFPGLCDPKTCGPHGTCEELNATHVLCACRDYWVGQTCEQFRPIEYAASFDGSAFVVFSSDEFPHLISDREEVVEFKLRTRARYGLIFWQGQQPIFDEEAAMEDFDLTGEDFLSIGLLDGHLAFSYELGGGAAQLISEAPINDGKPHFIRAVRKGRNGTLQVDGGTPIRGRSSGILAMLNVEGHIFVGGVPDLHLMTAGIHTQNFVGCLAELALNGYRLDLMGHAIDGRNVRPCREWRPKRLRRRRQWMRMMLRRQRMRKAAMMKRAED